MTTSRAEITSTKNYAPSDGQHQCTNKHVYSLIRKMVLVSIPTSIARDNCAGRTFLFL